MNGINYCLFIPESVCEKMIQQLILRLENPSYECSNQIYEELRKLLYKINFHEIERFEILHKEIFFVMEKILAKCYQKTNLMIKNLIEIEIGFINTNHPDFLQEINSVFENMEQLNFEENINCKKFYIKRKIFNYNL